MYFRVCDMWKQNPNKCATGSEGKVKVTPGNSRITCESTEYRPKVDGEKLKAQTVRPAVTLQCANSYLHAATHF